MLNVIIISVFALLVLFLICYLFDNNQRTKIKRRKPGSFSSGNPIGDVFKAHKTDSNETRTMHFLKIEHYSKKGIEDIPIVDDGNGFLIGRATYCDWIISEEESQFIGREHCSIYLDQETNAYYLEDYSRNGCYVVEKDGQVTRVNGRIQLYDGITLQLSDVRVVVRSHNPFAVKFNTENYGGNINKTKNFEYGKR